MAEDCLLSSHKKRQRADDDEANYFVCVKCFAAAWWFAASAFCCENKAGAGDKLQTTLKSVYKVKEMPKDDLVKPN